MDDKQQGEQRAAVSAEALERKRREEARLRFWLERGQAALAVIVPPLGFVWAAWFLGRRALEWRVAGLCLAGWALLGCALQLVVWGLWGDSLTAFLVTPYSEGVRF